jgi:hypothetical protein
LSLDDLLADACCVAVHPFASNAVDNATATSPTANPITPTAGPAAAHNSELASSKKASRTKRTSREAFDHDAIARFLAQCTWNDLASGSGALAAPDNATLRAAAVALGLEQFPSILAAAPSSAAKRVASVACDAALTWLSVEGVLHSGQRPTKRRPRALSPDLDACGGAFDGEAVARFLAAGSWNDWALPPGPAADRALMQAARTLGLAHPTAAFRLSPLFSPTTPGLHRRDCDRAVPASTSAAAASSWATAEALATEPSRLKSSHTRAVEVAAEEAAAMAGAEEAPITGLAPAHQKHNDSRGDFGGASSGCIASAFVNVLVWA